MLSLTTLGEHAIAPMLDIFDAEPVSLFRRSERFRGTQTLDQVKDRAFVGDKLAFFSSSNILGDTCINVGCKNIALSPFRSFDPMTV